MHVKYLMGIGIILLAAVLTWKVMNNHMGKGA